MRLAKLYGLILILMLCTACAHNARLEYALEFAGENRAELEKVLTHYKDSGLKYDAACFLIENMPRYYTYVGDELDSVKAAKATVIEKDYLDEKLKNKWGAFSYRQLDKVYDAHVITADYLIENIDLAFSVWQSRAWNKRLSFEDFCELILPYRIDDEPLDNWRSIYNKRYSAMLDSLYPEGKDVVEAVRILVSVLDKEGMVYCTDFDLPRYGASFLLEKRVGGCRESCDLSVYMMRSVGIPVTTDIYLYSPGIQHGHLWNVVKDTTGHYVPFWFREFRAERGGSDGRKKGKVYRMCYGRQLEKMKGMYADVSVPVPVRNPYLKDVTEEYFGANTAEVRLDCRKEDKFAYLSVFSPGGWIPVDIAQIKGGEAVVKDIEPGVVFVPLVNRVGSLHPAGYPFRLVNGKVNYFCPSTEKNQVVLWRKYPVNHYLREWMSGVKGARIEGSDTPDFSCPELIYKIEETPILNYNVVEVNPRKKYRYIRYTAAEDKRAEIAELAFYNSMQGEECLVMKVIEGSEAIHKSENLVADKMCDGNYLSYFRSEDAAGYAVFDLGKPEWIRKLVYVPRNDDNFITPGDVYELFYQNGTEGWISLGRKVAIERTLFYDNVPANALLWLRNLSRGREEQVFWMENGKQVFLGK